MHGPHSTPPDSQFIRRRTEFRPPHAVNRPLNHYHELLAKLYRCGRDSIDRWVGGGFKTKGLPLVTEHAEKTLKLRNESGDRKKAKSAPAARHACEPRRLSALVPPPNSDPNTPHLADPTWGHTGWAGGSRPRRAWTLCSSALKLQSNTSLHGKKMQAAGVGMPAHGCLCACVGVLVLGSIPIAQDG